MLKDTQVKAAQPRVRSYKLYDGGGLFLLVHPNGSKYWRARYVLHGKEKLLALGIYPEVGISKARDRADEVRVQLARGEDPALERRKQKLAWRVASGTTFAVVAAQWLEVKDATASTNYKRDLRAALNAHLLPKLGPLPVADIDAPILLGALKMVEARGKLELTRRCRMWARQILDYATAIGARAGVNPAVALTADVLRPPTRINRPALTGGDAGRFLRRLVDYPGRAETRLAVTLLLLTAARPGEIRAARWEEIDFKGMAWRIPAARMKARRDHLVPLSRQALSALGELHVLTGHSEWLFPGPSKRVPYMSENTLGKAFKLLLPERHVVPHGCRAFFSTCANESHSFASDVIEQALAHADKDAVRAAYNRAEYRRERAKLMQWWADELDVMRAGV